MCVHNIQYTSIHHEQLIVNHKRTLAMLQYMLSCMCICDYFAQINGVFTYFSRTYHHS